ncbi:PoNe immunity protein domain-containing protein [Leucobacter sp. wl10]|uniref:PoNe immunity protein domain-containing protein n=1 Tax=Leucobacter sp. wl10 TaxID=2304677 RepID=UPI0013C36B98|nr:PoNe immunity protein domain-containing protein [Leucobacter sp. wl10]
MVRDTRADQAYFDDVVEYLAGLCASDDERLARPAESFRDPKRLGLVAGDAMKRRWDRFSSLYSQGASADELRVEYDIVLAAAERALRLAKAHIPEELRAKRFAFGYNKDFFREWLLLVSLALAFDVDDVTFDRAVSATELGWGDRLLGRLIASRRPGHPVGDVLAFPRIVGELDAAFEAGSADEAESAVGRYLSSWYPAWEGIWGWGGHEQVPKRQYHGYWAFETLGVVAALRLDESSFNENAYYPRELAAPEPS